jgi:hypothetical protein
LNGTFTHPSPLAGFFYTGSPAPPAVTFLVEQRDGFSLFGRPLADVDAAGFNALVGPLRVSAVVALAEDRSRLGFVAGNPAFTGPASIGPFLVFFSREARPLPVRNGPQRWRLPVAAHAAGWSETGMAYSPLWRAEANGHALRLRSDGRGLLEVELPAGDAAEVELVHAPGVAEWSGLAVTSVCALVLAAVWIRRRVRP